MINDTPKHKGLRKKLVALLSEKGIKSTRVLDAINAVPRHLFMDSGFLEHAYQDKAFPIGADQTISQPYTVAYQTELLQIQANDKVLEIGTGSGYQTAVLCQLGAQVFTIERQKELFKKAQRFLPKLHIYPKKIVYGDGYLGMPEKAPFDAIIVTAGAPLVPKPLLNQLKIEGRLVIPVGKDTQTMFLIIRKSETEFEKHLLGEFKFVPLLADKSS